MSPSSTARGVSSRIQFRNSARFCCCALVPHQTRAYSSENLFRDSPKHAHGGSRGLAVWLAPLVLQARWRPRRRSISRQ